MFLFPVFFTGAVGVRGEVVQLGGPLMIFVMRSIVISRGHRLEAHNLPGFGVGFLGKLIGAIRIFKGALRMPVTGLVIALFVVFGGGPMGVRRKFVLFRGSPMNLVHGRLSFRGKIARHQVWRSWTGSRAVPLMDLKTATIRGEATRETARG
jgi:hypothetical protein